jgi:caa(3)-type oxidase subunit IV
LITVKRRLRRTSVAFNPVVALLIATIKATLVVLFFMHVKGASEKLTAAVVVVWLFLSCDSDYRYRWPTT